jgi:hypothetical protein
MVHITREQVADAIKRGVVVGAVGGVAEVLLGTVGGVSAATTLTAINQLSKGLKKEFKKKEEVGVGHNRSNL